MVVKALGYKRKDYFAGSLETFCFRPCMLKSDMFRIRLHVFVTSFVRQTDVTSSNAMTDVIL